MNCQTHQLKLAQQHRNSFPQHVLPTQNLHLEHLKEMKIGIGIGIGFVF
jgi:hypothetical protein